MNTRTAESKIQMNRRGGIDPAALAAASLASAISIMAQPGPYTQLSLVVGFTILVLIMSYDVDPQRTFFQSVAYSSVIGLTIALASGYPLEALMRTNNLCDPKDSAVSDLAITAIWILFTCIFLTLDRLVRVRK